MFSGSLALGLRWLSYWLHAVDEHSLQAPYIYNFYNCLVKRKPDSNSIREIRGLRMDLLKDERLIQVTDFGAGANRSHYRKISSIARTSNQPKISRLLHNYCTTYKPDTIVELGTSLGLSTLYMAMVTSQGRIHTIEGCPHISALALSHFERFNAENIELITGDLDQSLPKLLTKLNAIDLLFVDANHRYEPTVRYFTQCLPKFHEGTVVVLDDIHWSGSMERAWEELKNHPQVSLSADLFYAGILLFKKNITRAHYILSW